RWPDDPVREDIGVVFVAAVTLGDEGGYVTKLDAGSPPRDIEAALRVGHIEELVANARVGCGVAGAICVYRDRHEAPKAEARGRREYSLQPGGGSATHRDGRLIGEVVRRDLAHLIAHMVFVNH